MGGAWGLRAFRSPWGPLTSLGSQAVPPRPALSRAACHLHAAGRSEGPGGSWGRGQVLQEGGGFPAPLPSLSWARQSHWRELLPPACTRSNSHTSVCPPEPLQGAFYRCTLVTVPWVQPPDQGQAPAVRARDVGPAFSMGVSALGSVCWGGSRSQTAGTLPAQLRAVGLLLLFSPLPWLRGPWLLLELDRLCRQQAVQGCLFPPCGLQTPELWIPLSARMSVGQGQGARERRQASVCSAGQAVGGKGDKAEGPGEGFVLGTLLCRCWALNWWSPSESGRAEC